MMLKKPAPKHPQVSVRGETYDLVKKYCVEKGMKPGELVDELCMAFFERRRPAPERPESLFTAEEKEQLPRDV